MALLIRSELTRPGLQLLGRNRDGVGDNDLVDAAGGEVVGGIAGQETVGGRGDDAEGALAQTHGHGLVQGSRPVARAGEVRIGLLALGRHAE